MKLLNTFLVSLFLISCAGSKEAHFAEYGFEHRSNSENNLAALFLNRVTYHIITDGKLLETRTGYAKNENGNIRVNMSGPTEAVCDIINNQIIFGGDTNVLSFKPVVFRQIQSVVTINGYKCNVFVNDRKDTVYLSDKLPYYINPFFLNERSIKYGLVKATLSSSGVYTLTRYFKSKSKALQSIQKPGGPIKETPNVFFK